MRNIQPGPMQVRAGAFLDSGQRLYVDLTPTAVVNLQGGWDTRRWRAICGLSGGARQGVFDMVLNVLFENSTLGS